MKRFHVLACDYDGTLATHGKVDGDTLAALENVQASGRRLVMVTGRRLDELMSNFPESRRFDRIVAENGAVVLDPSSGKEELLAEPPPTSFLDALAHRGVGPIEIGRAIVATWEPHEAAVLGVIRDLGLGLQIILNKGAVMVLPGTVSKATGLKRALQQLGYSARNTVAVGDAENDHALLSYCECGAAVANAVQALKDRADIVLQRDHGAGVIELIAQLLDDDLASWSLSRPNRRLKVGETRQGEEILLPTYGANLLLQSPSDESLLQLVTGLTSQLTQQGYQWCAVSAIPFAVQSDEAVVLGADTRAPTLPELKHALDSPQQRVVLNCEHLNALDRSPFIAGVAAEFVAQRLAKGRPHWLLWIGGEKLFKNSQAEFSQLDRGMMFASCEASWPGDAAALPRCVRVIDQALLPDSPMPVPLYVSDARENATSAPWVFGSQDGKLWFDRARSIHTRQRRHALESHEPSGD